MCGAGRLGLEAYISEVKPGFQLPQETCSENPVKSALLAFTLFLTKELLALAPFYFCGTRNPALRLSFGMGVGLWLEI